MRLHAILSAGGLGLQTGKEKDTEFSHRTLMANTLFLYFPTLTANAAFLLNGGRRGTGLGGPAGTWQGFFSESRSNKVPIVSSLKEKARMGCVPLLA